MMAADEALQRLAEHLRGDPVIAPYVGEPSAEPRFGPLVAAGPRAAEAPGEYSFLVEAIREGYLLHYEQPRLLDGADDDLALLAGDYLYALGLERLAARGDLEAVAELADLISLSAQLHATADGPPERAPEALWLAVSIAVAAGSSPDLERGKGLLRGAETAAAVDALIVSARRRAADSGLSGALAEAAQQVGLALPERG
jgi:hypothetical protein